MVVVVGVVRPRLPVHSRCLIGSGARSLLVLVLVVLVHRPRFRVLRVCRLGVVVILPRLPRTHRLLRYSRMGVVVVVARRRLCLLLQVHCPQERVLLLLLPAGLRCVRIA